MNLIKQSVSGFSVLKIIEWDMGLSQPISLPRQKNKLHIKASVPHDR
jgi:hypothetical protein